MNDIELIPVNGKFCVTIDTFNQLLDNDNKKKQLLEQIATYVTNCLDKSMINNKIGKDILDMIMDGVKNEQN